MISNYNRYNDYYLVNDVDMDEVGFDELPKKCCSRRCKIIGLTILICLLVLLFILIFVVLPLIFMNSIKLQRTLIFTHLNLPQNETYYKTFKFPSFKNKYLKVKDLDGKTNVSLGVWHILPVDLAYLALHDSTFNYDNALLNSTYGVLIYFHGTGEDRSDSIRKYQLLSDFFHIIAFDYRSYADSSKNVLSEKAIINDCVQLYHWVRKRTNSSIYIWGHSLGAALAAGTVAALENVKEYPQALILESGFTSLRNELFVHPYGKIFAWLPWFELTILDPLYRNGFIFDTAANIVNITCPMMILHAEDDRIIPVKFGRELYKIALARPTIIENSTVYHEFEKKLDYKHFFLYEDPFLKYYIMDFIVLVQGNETTNS